MLISTAEDLPIGAAICGANRQDATFTGSALASMVIEPPVLAVEVAPSKDPAGSDSKTPGNSRGPQRRYGSGKLSGSSVRQQKNQLYGGQDLRALPYLRADGNFAKIPARLQSKQQGFRLWAPEVGQSRRGLGRIRASVERSHALLNQFGRVCRRLDRNDQRYLAWVQLACCIIFMRQGFFP